MKPIYDPKGAVKEYGDYEKEKGTDEIHTYQHTPEMV